MLSLYKTIVRPQLEYANVVWFPYLKRQSISLEKVQRRATRLILNIRHLNYSERLKQLKLPSLKFRRLRCDLIQTYKIFNKVDNIANFFPTNQNANTRNSLFKIFLTHSNTNLKKFSFKNRVAKHWNPSRALLLVFSPSVYIVNWGKKLIRAPMEPIKRQY